MTQPNPISDEELEGLRQLVKVGQGWTGSITAPPEAGKILQAKFDLADAVPSLLAEITAARATIATQAETLKDAAEAICGLRVAVNAASQMAHAEFQRHYIRADRLQTGIDAALDRAATVLAAIGEG